MDTIYKISIEKVIYDEEKKYDRDLLIYQQRVEGDIDLIAIINAVNSKN